MQFRKSRIGFALTLLALALLAVACGGSGGGSDESANLSATQVALEATQAALDAAQSDSSADSANSADSSADTSSADAPSSPSSAAEPYYTEEWDESNPNWTYFLVRGEEGEFDLFTDGDGNLVFDIPTTYVWLYLTYDAYSYTDIYIEAHIRNVGANNNNVSLICRQNDRGWYEFNIANNGLYWIYRYEADSDEYTQLYNGGSERIKTGVGENTYGASCEGTQLTLYINGEEVRSIADLYYEEGLAGVGVASFDIVPVEIWMDYTTLSAP